MTDLHEMTMDELQAELETRIDATRDARAELEDAQSWLAEARREEREVRGEIKRRYDEDRDKLASWNASVRAAKQMTGRAE